MGKGDGNNGYADYLIARLRVDDEWQSLPLGTLLPRLDAVSPSLQESCLSTRVVNALGRMGVTSWSDLAARSAAAFLLLPNTDPKTLEELVAVAAQEWARTFLGEGSLQQLADERGRAARANAPARESRPGSHPCPAGRSQVASPGRG